MKNKFSKVHPDLQDAIKMSPSIHYNKMNLWLIRLGMALIRVPKASEDVSIENVFIARQDDKSQIRLRIYRPKAITSSTPVMVWMHGGGYVMGNPELDDQTCAQYACEAGISVVSADYRLAPKHPFPAGLEDCYSALIWGKKPCGTIQV